MSAYELGHLSEWNIEVDFLVARARTTASPDVRGSDRWVCPASISNPHEACAQYCADLVTNYHASRRTIGNGIQYQAVPESQKFPSIKPSVHRRNMPKNMYYWWFSSAPRARANSSSPKEYDWIGLSMRCPLQSIRQIVPTPQVPQHSRAKNSEASSYAPKPPLDIETFLAVLRGGVEMHVNSSCQMRIFFCHQPDGMELVHAKRMLTICWMLESDLLLKLRPDVRDPHIGHYLPITTSSAVANYQSHFPKGYMEDSPETVRVRLKRSWPKSYSDMAIMRRNLPPKFRDACLQERIHLLWGASTFGELSNMLQSPDGETTVAIYASRANVQPYVEMRYSVWHPQAESMRHWLQLLGQICCFSMGASSDQFGRKIDEIDNLLMQVKKIDPEDRWKPLISLMDIDSVAAYRWSELKNNERDGCLSPENLDKQGVLDALEWIGLASR
ncbi:hypothetical protein BGZ63DRAFT_364476 [Mariannaea sp. PMI_226]|nr:hypothetical protein BGZ63DRAFT_364476 [Mariannaea sp. PMI_226]